MMTRKNVLALLVSVLVAAGCSEGTIQVADLEASPWTIVGASVDGDAVDLDEFGRYTIEFQAGHLIGYDGCNWITGDYDSGPTTLIITGGGITERHCRYVRGFEPGFYGVDVQYELTEGTLTLSVGSSTFDFAASAYHVSFGQDPY